MSKALIHPQSFNSEILSKSVKDSLEQRFANSKNYNREEAIEVSETEHSLLPEGFEIERAFSDEIRVLCATSRFQRQAQSITSHRKYVGPVIVFFKKLVWKFLDSQLSKKFKQIEEFNTLQIIAQIKTAVRFSELKKNS